MAGFAGGMGMMPNPQLQAMLAGLVPGAGMAGAAAGIPGTAAAMQLQMQQAMLANALQQGQQHAQQLQMQQMLQHQQPMLQHQQPMLSMVPGGLGGAALQMGAGGGGMPVVDAATKTLRELHVGNIPPNITEISLGSFLNQTLIQGKLTASPGDPIVKTQISTGECVLRVAKSTLSALSLTHSLSLSRTHTLTLSLFLSLSLSLSRLSAHFR